MGEFIKQEPYGVFEVITEGDVEGKTSSHLGTFEGYIDEIAFALADKVYYSLHFKRVKKLDMKPKKSTVSITFSEIGDLSNFHQMLKYRDVTFTKGNFYNSITLQTKDANEIKRNIALDKLTSEEKLLLGL